MLSFGLLKSKLQRQEQARCGRCALVLPDETMTFCPACGVPFSKTPPTTRFLSLNQRPEFKLRPLLNPKVIFYSGLALVSLSLLMLSLSELYNFQLLKRFESPSVRVFTKDFPEFASLDPWARRLSIQIGIQSFEDHFGVAISNVSISENTLPHYLTFLENQKFRPLFSNLSFWQEFFKGQKVSDFEGPMNRDLLLTNLKIKAEQNNSGIETGHLEDQGLVSGLAHPRVIITSSYRLLNDSKNFKTKGLRMVSAHEQARFLGQYVIAHELGHSILGLEDIVVRDSDRLPASNIDLSRCIMHSDAGGGFRSIASLAKSEMGKSQACELYSEVTEAFKLRNQAIEKFKEGNFEKASTLHKEALVKLESSGVRIWLIKEWQEEASVFESGFRRWLSRIFMVQ